MCRRGRNAAIYEWGRPLRFFSRSVRKLRGEVGLHLTDEFSDLPISLLRMLEQCFALHAVFLEHHLEPRAAFFFIVAIDRHGTASVKSTLVSRRNCNRLCWS